MKNLLVLSLLLFTHLTFSQIKGVVRDDKGKPISYATIIVERTQQGTISNDKGQYELLLQNEGEYNLVYQFLGYKTVRKKISYKNTLQVVDVILQEEEFQLDDIVIKVGKNPADDIIRKAIKNKGKNTAGMSSYTADFYSKGVIKTLKLPKFLQNKITVNDQKAIGMDSIGKGMLYLSETVSELKYQKPNKLKEHIVASKVSGNDNGYSFNTADESFYDFYDNHLSIAGIGTKLISPLADAAFSYYKYNLEAVIKDQGVVINKVKVIPKSKAQPVFEGDLYLVEETGAIYGVDLKVSGISLQEPIIEEININQNFFYNVSNKSWVKRSQNIDLTFGALGASIQGVFLSVFNNYNFEPQFTRATFDKEILSFAKDVNKQDDSFWNRNRLFALSDEELKDYHFKDSVRVVRDSPAYKDSIRAKYNKFSVEDVLMGYTYTGKDDRYKLSYDGVIGIDQIGFNTVQGFTMNTNLRATLFSNDKKSYSIAKVNFDYGFASDRFRAYGHLYHKFNDKSQSSFYVKGGSQIKQFYGENINEYINTAFSLLARKNYAKYYNNEELYIGYGGKFVEEAIRIHAAMGYEERSALFNNANGSFYQGSRAYTSNNPLDPYNNESAAIDLHHLYKFKLGVGLSLGMKYITYPDKRVYMSNRKYPSINLQYEKGFAGSTNSLNYDLIEVKFNQLVPVSNKGELDYNIKFGHYFGGEGISFVDQKHFAGNQTHLNINRDELSYFNLLPYYSLSTNKSYMETHIEYDFKGYLINKIPLLRWTGWNVVVGYHNASTTDNKPYQELTAGLSNFGFGKINFFRIDYVRSYWGTSFAQDGVMIGFKKSF